MKNLILSLLLLLTGGIASAQSWNIITGKNEFTDSMRNRKLKNNVAGDSLLTTDNTGKFKQIKNSTYTYYGVDSVVYNGTTHNLCIYSYGLTNCYTISGGGTTVTSGVDSVKQVGNNLCVYVGGVATCYTITNTINNNSYITNYIDSSVTIYNNPACATRLLSGTVTIDSLFAGRSTDIYFSLNCTNYFIPAQTFSITGSGANDFYVIVIGDTAQNIGTIVGTTNPADIPTLVDDGSQILLKVYFIPAFSTTPQSASIEWVYREGDDSYALDKIGTVSSAYDSVYATNPFAGLHSLRIPVMTSGQYFEWWMGSTHTSSEFQLLTFKLRLAAAFGKNTKWGITLYNDASLATSNSIIISDGVDGYNRSVFGSYQFIASDISKLNFILPTFNRVRVTFIGGSTAAQQWDDVKFQGDAPPTNTNTYVQTVNGIGGANVIFKVGNKLTLSADSSYYELRDSASNTILQVQPTFLIYMRTADTCLVIDTIDSKNYTIALNPYCRGGGGGGSGTVTSVGLTSSDITVGGTSPITTSGTYTLTLPNVNSNVGSFTNANITVNAKGQVTAAANGSAGTGTVTSVAKGYGIVADGAITTTGTITADSSVITSQTRTTAGLALKEDVVVAANTAFKYWTGYKTWGNFNDTVRAAVSATGTGISYNSSTGVFTGTGITLSSLSATSPIFYNNATGVISSQAATSGQNGYLTSTDWSTFNSKQAAISVTSPITLTGASVGMVNQGTTTTVLHGNAAGNPSFSAVGLTTDVTGTLPVLNGGTGTTTPSLVAGTNITSITGTWPNQTINASGGGSSTFAALTDVTYSAPPNNTVWAWNTATSKLTQRAFVPIVTTGATNNSYIIYDSINAQYVPSNTAGSNGNIYNIDGSLTSDRKLTHAGYSLTIQGGSRSNSAGDSAALILQSTPGLNSTNIMLDIKNNSTAGRRWQIRSLSTGQLDIRDSARTTSNVRFDTTSRTFFGSDNLAALSASTGYPLGTSIVTSGILVSTGAIRVQQAAPTSSGTLGIELQALGTENYIDAYNRQTSAYLNFNYRALKHSFQNGPVNINTTTSNGSNLNVQGSLATAIQSRTLTYTITATDHIVNYTSGSVTINLPTAVGISGRQYIIKNSGAGVITIATTSSQTIDGVTTYSLATQYKYVMVVSDGANWIIVANN